METPRKKKPVPTAPKTIMFLTLCRASLSAFLSDAPNVATNQPFATLIATAFGKRNINGCWSIAPVKRDGKN